MSLARAITKRIKNADDGGSSRVHRSNTTRRGPIDISTISSPVEFLSTTNVHALTAPDIRNASSETGSSSSSTHSGDDSIFSAVDRTFLNGLAGDSSPVTPLSPPSDSSADFFGAKPVAASASAPSPVVAAPSVPERSPSHSKRLHVELARKRSVSRMSPPPSTASELTRTASVRDTTVMFSPGVQNEAAVPAVTAANSTTHPFGHVLDKVNEVAEEFGAVSHKPAVVDEEDQYLRSRGLYKFGVQDYLNEIAGIGYGGVYEDQLGLAANPWI